MKKIFLLIFVMIMLVSSGCMVQTNLKPDNDKNSYFNYNLSYDNGTVGFQSPHPTTYNISNSSEEKNINLKYTNYQVTCFNDSIIRSGSYDFSVCNFDGETLDTVTSNDKITRYKFYEEDLIYYLTEKNELFCYSINNKKSDKIMTFENQNNHFYIKDDYVYLEYLSEDNSSSTFEEYKSGNLIDTYTLEFAEDITKKVKVIDLEIAGYRIFELKGYVFYDFYFSNYQYDNLYRIDPKSGKCEFLGRFEQPSFCKNSTDIFFAVENIGGQDYYEYEQSGIWKMDPITLEKTLIIADYYNNEFLCTDNFLYIYDIFTKQLPLK